ncbi:MAG TPA: FAD:protein FMN transferase [Acidobacteriota bacterium]|nr:FAD:protein FMN transferase [Acidobacteriota bacterium]
MTTSQRTKLLGLLALTAVAAALAWQIYSRHQRTSEPTVRVQQTLMGTLWSVQVWVPEGDPARVRRDIAEALEEVARVESVMSEWRQDSPISRLNRSAGGPGREVPAELAAIIERGIEYGRLSGGAFDISWKGMGDLWSFGDDFRIPSQAEIEQALSRVDYRLIEVEDPLKAEGSNSDATAGTARGDADQAAATARESAGQPGDAAQPSLGAAVRVGLPKPGMALGLGGIAKGYGIDRAGAVLREMGYANFLVDGGGDVLTSGRRAGRPWRVGIQNPRSVQGSAASTPAARPDGGASMAGAGQPLLGYVEVSGGAVATSGDYQRFRIVDGVRYHHIIDPRSGRPARGCRSVTVLAPSAEQADALATAIFVLGPEEGLALADSLEKVETLIVDSRGSIQKTAGFPFSTGRP